MPFLIPKDMHYSKEELKEHEQIRQRKEEYYGPDRSLSRNWVVRNAHWIMTGFLFGFVVYILVVIYHDKVHEVFNVQDYRITACTIEEDTDTYKLHVTYKNPSSKEQVADIYRIVSDQGEYASRYDLTIDTPVWDLQWKKSMQYVVIPGYASSTVTYSIPKEKMPEVQEMTIVTEAYEPQEFKVSMP